MNNQGFSNDNLHIGDTYIKNGSLFVDKDATIEGDLTVNGTINGGITTTNENIAVSRWFTQQQSLLNFSSYSGIFLNSNTGDSTTLGNNIIPASDLTTGENNYSVLHVRLILRINTTDIAQPNQWQCRLRLDDGTSQGTIEWELQEFTGTLQTDSERIQDFYLTFIRNPADPTKINISNQCFKHSNEASTTAPTTTNNDKLFLSNNQFKLGSETGSISMLLPTTKSYFCQFNNYADGRALTITMACQRPNPNAFNTIDYGVLTGELYTFKKQTLPTGGTPLNDHLLLSNLNGGTGDGGHINLYDRRGIKPMTGAMNMNNNAINNVLNINSTTNINLNPSGNVDINGDVDMGNNRILGVPEIVGDGGDMTIRNGAGESIILNSTTNTIDILNNNLNMNNNQIDNVAVINNGLGSLALIGPSLSSSVVIDPDPSNSVILGGPNDVVVSSNNDVNIISNAGIVNVNSNITNFNVGGTPRLTIDATEVGIGNILNLNTNDITNANFISANKIISGDYETTTGFITFFGLGGITPSFSGGGLDLNNGSLNSVISINNITPVGGLYAGTSDGTLITATTTETSILPLSAVGPGLSIPGNGFSIGDSFHFVCSGDFSSNNGDTATLRIKANGTNLGVIVVQLTGATNEFYEIEIDFTIRNIGGAGVADIVSNIDFTYSDSGATSWRGSRVVFVNNTTFDTTISNTFEVTCQFSSASANNSLQTRHATLGKVF